MAGGLSAAPIGFSAPAPAIGHNRTTCECWTVTAADVDAWLRIAEPGQTFIYAHGPQLVQGGAAARVNALAQAGDVTPHHRRTDDGGFDFLIRRNKVKITRAPVCTSDMMAVLVELQAFAGDGRRCPTDEELAEATGQRVDQVKWQLKKLRQANFIRVETLATSRHPRWRIVTVVATGAQTAEPRP